MKTPLLLLKLAALIWLLAPANTGAFYNPQTGRFLNRDPIQEKGGVNLFAAVRNQPLSAIDQLGLMSLFRKRCCCCCVEDLKFENVQGVHLGSAYGHYFAVRVNLSYKTAAARSGCTLTWMERSSRPPETGVAPNTWYDAGSMHQDSAVWEKWNGHAQNAPCPGPDTMPLVDEPTADTALGPRTTYFAITVRSSPGCPCLYAAKTIYAKQRLATVGEEIVRQEFMELAQESVPGLDLEPQGPPVP